MHPSRWMRKGRCLSLATACGLSLLASGAQAQVPITETRPLPVPRAFHGSAVLGDYLYVIGGGTYVPQGNQVTHNPDLDTTVFKVPIAANSQIGQWTTTTSIPSPRYYINQSTVVLNDVVYVIGGSTQAVGGDSYNTAIWAKPLQDGTLTPWVTTEPFGSGFSAAAAVATPGHLHVLGGQKTDNSLSREVWSNAIYLDGSLSQWVPGPPLPLPIWFHHAGVVAGRLYMWGGLGGINPQEIPPSPYIFSAPILASGQLGAWRQESTLLSVPFYGAASAVAGHYLLSFSPRYQGGQETNDVWWTYITPTGVMPFERRQSDIPIRIYHSVAPDYRRGTIYIPAGRPVRADLLPTQRVFFFSLSGQAREQAEKAWQATQAQHAHSASLRAGGADGAVTRQLTYVAQTQLPDGAVPGFMTVTDARRAATSQGRPMVLYFTLKDAQPCIEQKQFLGDARFTQLAQQAAFAWIDTTEYPQLAQQMGVYRVPTWVFYDVRGVDRGRRVGVLEVAELQNLLGYLK